MILLIGSEIYKERMQEYANTLSKKGIAAMLPTFDTAPGLDVLQICGWWNG